MAISNARAAIAISLTAIGVVVGAGVLCANRVPVMESQCGSGDLLALRET